MVTIPSGLCLSSAEESEGWMPDYWLDTDNPVEEIVYWVSNSEEYLHWFERDSQ